MKNVKLILIATEIAMLIGIAMLVFMVDWKTEAQYSEVWMIKVLIVLMSVAAVTLQREQQNINLDEEE